MSAGGAKLYVRESSGRYATARWACVWITQIVFYGLPWLSWHGRPLLQLDLQAQKFYLFGIVLWPQDFIYLAAMVIFAIGLQMLSTTVVGRIWCGYGCPHSVYSEIFLWVERQIEGGRGARIRLDAGPWTLRKWRMKIVKHAIWLALAFWTGLSFVGFFTPIRALLGDLGSAAAGPWSVLWIGLYGGLTYVNAGWMREQFCRIICPHARMQSALFDRDTLVVTYDAERGEPRGLRNRKNIEIKSSQGVVQGDCVDCTLCIQVCPTGSDIRRGMQYDCMGCGSCIDACDAVMDKIGAPRGLIRYAALRPAALAGASANRGRKGATENVAEDASGTLTEGISKGAVRLLRPRVLIYAGLLATLAGVFVGSLAMRVPLRMDVIRDRSPGPGLEAGDGVIDNVYRLNIVNSDERPHRYMLSVSGLPTLALAAGGAEPIALAANSSRQVPIRLRAAAGQARPGANPIRIVLRDQDDGRQQVAEKAVFLAAPARQPD